MHAVSGLTVVTQALFAGLVGAVTHGRYRAVDCRLAASMSVTIFAASLLGAVGSTRFSHEFLLGIFALLASIAAALLFFAQTAVAGEGCPSGAFPKPRAVSVAATVGVLGWDFLGAVDFPLRAATDRTPARRRRNESN